MAALTTTEAPGSRTGVPARLPLWRRILFRLGLVLTAVMALFNTLNGGLTLLRPEESPASAVLGGLLFGIGLPTLLLVALAWLPLQWALITVIALRAGEFLTMWIPLGEGDWYSAPENRPFYLVLVAVSIVVCALMAFGLRRRRG